MSMLSVDPLQARDELGQMVLRASELFDVPMCELVGPYYSRRSHVVEVRRVVIAVARQWGASFPQIGEVLEQDSSTVQFGWRWVRRHENDRVFQEHVRRLKAAQEQVG